MKGFKKKSYMWKWLQIIIAVASVIIILCIIELGKGVFVDMKIDPISGLDISLNDIPPEVAIEDILSEQNGMYICDTLSQLNELLKIDLSDAVIDDIRCEFIGSEADASQLYLFLIEADGSASERFSQVREEGICDSNLNSIPAGEIISFEAINIDVTQIINHLCWFREVIVGEWVVPYEINLYEVKTSPDRNSNIILSAIIPCKMTLNTNFALADDAGDGAMFHEATVANR